MSIPAKGDRVRIVIEGEVVQPVEANGTFWIGAAGKRCLINTATATVEILAPPEPEWQYGDVARAGESSAIVIRTPEGWKFPNGDRADDLPPLTLLVRDGRPVGDS